MFSPEFAGIRKIAAVFWVNVSIICYVANLGETQQTCICNIELAFTLFQTSVDVATAD